MVNETLGRSMRPWESVPANRPPRGGGAGGGQRPAEGRQEKKGGVRAREWLARSSRALHGKMSEFFAEETKVRDFSGCGGARLAPEPTTKVCSERRADASLVQIMRYVCALRKPLRSALQFSREPVAAPDVHAAHPRSPAETRPP
jgi:hypothetical protein